MDIGKHKALTKLFGSTLIVLLLVVLWFSIQPTVKREPIKESQLFPKPSPNQYKECHITESQDDWSCDIPCSCLFVNKMLVCTLQSGQGIIKNVYSDLNRNAWIRCNEQLTKEILKMDANSRRGEVG